jgi:hypothetical protein
MVLHCLFATHLPSARLVYLPLLLFPQNYRAGQVILLGEKRTPYGR